MYAPEPCGRLWDNNGDWRPCYLADNHDGTCHDANRDADLETHWLPQAKDPWL